MKKKTKSKENSITRISWHLLALYIYIYPPNRSLHRFLMMSSRQVLHTRYTVTSIFRIYIYKIEQKGLGIRIYSSFSFYKKLLYYQKE